MAHLVIDTSPDVIKKNAFHMEATIGSSKPKINYGSFHEIQYVKSTDTIYITYFDKKYELSNNIARDSHRDGLIEGFKEDVSSNDIESSLAIYIEPIKKTIDAVGFSDMFYKAYVLHWNSPCSHFPYIVSPVIVTSGNPIDKKYVSITAYTLNNTSIDTPSISNQEVEITYNMQTLETSIIINHKTYDIKENIGIDLIRDDSVIDLTYEIIEASDNLDKDLAVCLDSASPFEMKSSIAGEENLVYDTHIMRYVTFETHFNNGQPTPRETTIVPRNNIKHSDQYGKTILVTSGAAHPPLLKTTQLSLEAKLPLEIHNSQFAETNDCVTIELQAYILVCYDGRIVDANKRAYVTYKEYFQTITIDLNNDRYEIGFNYINLSADESKKISYMMEIIKEESSTYNIALCFRQSLQGLAPASYVSKLKHNKNLEYNTYALRWTYFKNIDEDNVIEPEYSEPHLNLASNECGAVIPAISGRPYDPYTLEPC